MKRLLCIFLFLLLAVPAVADGSDVTASTPIREDAAAYETNLTLACEAIDGVRVESGGTFSFNEIVGPRSREAGYRAAINGRGVSVTGGGVSQVASTLYLALRKLGDRVQYLEKSTYGDAFTGGYVDDADCAIVTDYRNQRDFSFLNRGSAFTVYMWVDSGRVNCSIHDEGGETVIYASLERTPIPLEGQNYLDNLSLACDAINGVWVSSGSTFSFNDVVGPRSREAGYRSAVNGRGVKVTGGGVSQVASTLYLALRALPAGSVSYVERMTYGDRYTGSYVDDPALAIVTDYANDRDFSFKNRTDGFTIRMWCDAGFVYCGISF